MLIVIARVQNFISSRLAGDQMVSGSVDILRTSLCDNSWRMYIALLLYLCAVVGAAAVTFQFIEQPGRRFFNLVARRLMQDKNLPSLHNS
jgi:peptidoglycan/LPS O-acetylase OafA/YrhL